MAKLRKLIEGTKTNICCQGTVCRRRVLVADSQIGSDWGWKSSETAELF